MSTASTTNPSEGCCVLGSAEAAYLAGLFDGEGCLTLLFRPRSRKHDGMGYSLGLAFVIANNHRGVLEWAQAQTKCGLLVSTRQGRHHRYVVTGSRHLLPLLQQLEPYLIVKKERAQCAIKFFLLRRHRPKGAHFSDEELYLLFRVRSMNSPNGAFRRGGRELSLDAFIALVRATRSGRRVIEWTPEMDAKLGTAYDRSVARLLGLKLHQVQARRTTLGIPVWKKGR